MKQSILYFAIAAALFSCRQQPEESGNNSMFRFNKKADSRWISFENRTGEKGNGGKENNGAKGHPCDSIGAGVTKVLMDVKGSGIIHRMWITISDRSPEMLRSLVIEMYWDGESKPAVSAPFGDFFGTGLSRRTAMENELFADPEGRSFISYIKMPFKTGARIVIKNESGKNLDMIFYDINYEYTPWNNDNLYFHCFWNRDTATVPSEDFVILPEVSGNGRYLGANIGVIADKAYEGSWWGEGEVKMYLDNDTDYPTMTGTGTEDYIGSAWGTGTFTTRFAGCTFASDSLQQWAFYRYHIPDPIFFKDKCRVTIQGIGGNSKEIVTKLLEKGVNLIPITIHEVPVLHHLYKKGERVDLKNQKPIGSTNFYRSDDWSSTAYFYLNKPVNELPLIQDKTIRTYKTK